MGYNQSINPTIQNKVQALAWRKQHQTSTPKVGETAPGFQLSDIKGQNPLTLSGLCQHKPEALVLAVSPDLHSSSSRLTYSNFTSDTINRSNFWLFISMKPPVDGWDISSSNRITDPQTIERSEWPAQSCPVDLLLALAYNGK